MIRTLLVFLLFHAIQTIAQEAPISQINGRIIADFSSLDAVYIVNKKRNLVSRADTSGYFNIQAKVSDTLFFSGFQIVTIKVIITQKDLEQENLLVQIKQEINQLEEVIVSSNINAVSLGIIPKGQKSYSAAERKLYTATDLNASANAGTMMGGSASIDPLINWLSGRTKMLKKGLEVEKKENYLRKVENIFSQEYITGTLNIPIIYVKGFAYFIVENKEFIAVLDSNNSALATLYIGELAIHYRELIANEN